MNYLNRISFFEQKIQEWKQSINQERTTENNSKVCQIDQVSQKIFQAVSQNLTLFVLNDLRMSSCPDIFDANYLQIHSLEITGNHITSVPNLTKTPELIELLISKNALVSLLGSSLFSLQKLAVLDLSDNALKEIPSDIGKLSLLNMLKIGNKKQLTDEEIENLIDNETEENKTNLRKQYQEQNQLWQKNQINELPQEIGFLTLLRSLDLQRIDLVSLPSLIGNLQNLSELNLRGNKLTTLPDSIGYLLRLRSLQLSFNKLVELPITLGDLTELKNLDVSYNRSLSLLPLALGNCEKLKHINWERTQISFLLVNTILTSCDAKQNHRLNLGHKLSTWVACSNLDYDFTGLRITHADSLLMNNWLSRLEHTHFPNIDQKTLARSVCQFIEGLAYDHEESKTRKLFFESISKT